MINKDIEIAVIGGGLSGFAVAIMFKRNGYDRVTVYERDTAIGQRKQGYGLTLLQGITALKTLGGECFERVKNIDTPSRSHYIFDSDGNIINFFGTIFWPKSEVTYVPKKNKKYNLHISRTNLRNILYDEFMKISNNVKFNYKLNTLKKTDNGKINISFLNGETVEADLVIGCDGINSVTRKFKYSPINDVSLNYLGMILILGITYVDHSLANKRVFQTVDGCTRLFAMPYANSDGMNFMWQLSFPLNEAEAKRLSKDNQLLKDHLIERCGKWHEPIPKMIQNTDLTLMMGIPAYDRDASLPSETLMDNIVLLGDAAHPMSPFKGQGANQALLDSVSLAKSIFKSDSIPKGIDAYESEMINRVRPKVDLSRERVASFHDENILKADSFEYRGANTKLIEVLNSKKINYKSGEDIEALIMESMKDLEVV